MVGKKTPGDIVTASVLASLAHASPFKSANEQLQSVLAEMDGKPDPNPFHGNEACDWGDMMEPLILTEAANRLGLTGLQLEHDAIFHDKLPFACSLDGTADAGLGHYVEANPAKGIYCPNGPVYIDGIGVLESKLTSNNPEDAPAPHRGVLQLQGQLLCTSHSWGAVCVLYNGIELRVFLYQADAAAQSKIINIVQEFEQRKISREPYPVISSKDGNAAYPESNGSAAVLQLPDEKAEWLAQLVNAKKAKAAAEVDIDEAEAALKEVMGHYEVASAVIGNTAYQVKWPMRNYKAQPEKVVPAKPAYFKRQTTLSLKALD